MQRSRTRQKRKKRKFLSIILLIILVIGAIFAFRLYSSFNNALDNIVNKSALEKSDKREKEVSLENKEAFTVLLLGVDEREGDKGRSDTMLLMSVNGKENSVEMLSIPRDTRVNIAGKNKKDKINHAYAFGGVDMSAKTVEEFLDIPVDYYVEMNMDGFKDLVDAVGGVTVDNPFAFSYGGESFKQGTIHLNGEEALQYTRMRKEDPKGDFGRQARQRQVIEGILDKGASMQSLWKYNDILGALKSNMQTNVSVDEMMDIQKHYAGARNNMKQEQIEGTGQKIDGVYYYLVPDEERDRVSSIFKDHLNLQ
ncbi:LCP family protein [Pseudobacillus badius]|uniref:LCP family glycopolymer transferase n=1 Tax=Bacillus badius TaxID=1455 RepID=UPI0007B08B3C|nr:LCP family protein [Bacillus badius]KZO00009.1 trascriptional regulator [Bacillus badius]MED0665559.1 LCP family protein [Bacillus badius]OCS86170.1 trascriptional regulator [Bacillus badius]OVE52369.1 LytR family transcriptional regulator [Bacillus badius]TDW04101.1 LytR family transcriptional attenuator [Bacillus badius]